MKPLLDYPDIELFSTCPPLNHADGASYMAKVLDVARWSDQVGCRGILVYADNSQLDPWLLSQIIVTHTRSLCPLVAVQPIYMHPYTVAKMVASIAHLYGRRMYLNLVAGGFKNDLLALNDTTPHDERYERLVEYAVIIKQLLAGEAVSFDGEYYRTDKLKLLPPVPAELQPGIFISGSSPAGMTAARTLGATAIQYPKPLAESRYGIESRNLERGVRIGVFSREQPGEAWALAHAQFPEDRKGELTRQLANKVSDSVWHRQLAEHSAGIMEDAGNREPYWLVPFQQYQTNCPYLVGDYSRVGRELAGYMELGYRTFILDVPPGAAELGHIRKAFDYALEESSACRNRYTTG
jgi:alkanesulfonate monooxygenase